ncbi:hypothetical protein AB0K60_36375 [Thermopolyspora sp. NPDC052614]|uniref:hypothetical protein n=1 Tax=Thermopolyspora sp. NPDC052614 TaxID=3155682 RepID=UPI0034448217
MILIFPAAACVRMCWSSVKAIGRCRFLGSRESGRQPSISRPMRLQVPLPLPVLHLHEGRDSGRGETGDHLRPAELGASREIVHRQFPSRLVHLELRGQPLLVHRDLGFQVPGRVSVAEVRLDGVEH